MKQAVLLSVKTRTTERGGGVFSKVLRGAAAPCALYALCVSVASFSAFSAEKADLLVTGGTVVTMDAERRIFSDGAVAVGGGRILAVGPRPEIEARYSARAKLSAAGRLVLPGLINTHTHAAMSLFRGMADDLKLQEWLEKYIFPAEARNVTADFVRWGTRLAALEMIRSGTTTYTDMYYFEEVAAEATREAGLRGVLGETILGFPAPDNKTPEAAFNYTEKFLEHWKNDALVVPAVAPHSAYTCSADILRQSRRLATKFGAPLLIHAAETETEQRTIEEKHHLSPVAYLDSLGLLKPRTVAAHCVWVSPGDIARLQANGTGVAHNPSSNMKLASGAAPVVEMLAAGLAVGLGTDGVAGSNNDVNMFEEMDLAAKLAKLVKRDPRALPAQQALEMATLLGARALGMEKQIGSLEAGKRADLITLRMDAPHAVPLYNIYSQIVYALKASDVEDVVVEGRMLMRARRILTLNEEQVKAEARKLAERVKASLR